MVLRRGSSAGGVDDDEEYSQGEASATEVSVFVPPGRTRTQLQNAKIKNGKNNPSFLFTRKRNKYSKSKKKNKNKNRSKDDYNDDDEFGADHQPTNDHKDYDDDIDEGDDFGDDVEGMMKTTMTGSSAAGSASMMPGGTRMGGATITEATGTFPVDTQQYSRSIENSTLTSRVGLNPLDQHAGGIPMISQKKSRSTTASKKNGKRQQQATTTVTEDESFLRGGDGTRVGMDLALDNAETVTGASGRQEMAPMLLNLPPDNSDTNTGTYTDTVDDEDEEGRTATSNSDRAVVATAGTLLEAAFVDPAYSWPPGDGEGRNAIELQATIHLLDEDDVSINTTESMKRRMKMPRKPAPRPESPPPIPWYKFYKRGCCRNRSAERDMVDLQHAEVIRDYEEKRAAAVSARQMHAQLKKEKIRQKEKEYRKRNKYSRVPEGILIYRLDTSTQMLSLVSQPSSKTDLDTLLRQCKVVKAWPSTDRSRRGMEIVDEHGNTHTLVACEQRTSTAWLEAMSLMFAKQDRSKSIFGISPLPSSRWTTERLQDSELTEIEDQYLNLANYSHKLIRAGALPGGKKGSGGAGGIYYSVAKVNHDPWEEPPEEEALEAIAKRRAVIKDSWDFYRMICSLLRDRNKYHEVFRRMKLDPVYPYLNSMTGLNDPGDAGYENLDKQVMQMDLPEYIGLSRTELARALCSKAETAMPSLVEICKALAGSLGMEEVGVGPIKEVTAAVRKAEKKYNGDVLKVTDYCRALLVVKDFPSLLALLELARDSFGPLIRRVKMSTLKEDHRAKQGGYRDCIINVELKGHICEIQVHLWSMWVVCGVEGYRHYRHCVEYNTDSFDDAYDALDGLDRKTMAELIVMAEEAVAETPLDNLEWYHEKYILDYFAEVGLFMKHGLDAWAEITLRHLIRLRMESPDIGPEHHETIVLYRYLARTLQAQNKHTDASEVMGKVRNAEVVKKTEKKNAEKSLWGSLACTPGTAYEMIVDPNRKYREEEERLRKEVKASKKHWRQVRQERFQFLDVDLAGVGGTKGDMGVDPGPADFEEEKKSPDVMC